MRFVVSGNNVQAIIGLESKAKILSSGQAKVEANRGLIDAGRRTKTKVQRAVYGQMALKSGTYTRLVSSKTRGRNNPGALTFDIFGVIGGQKIQEYRGLRVLGTSGRVAARMNSGRSLGDRGLVSSAVWNVPRVFKRSFGEDGEVFAVLPGSSRRAPKALWTFGSKSTQPRGADGKFVSSGKRYGKIRRLFGASLMKEIPQGQSLHTFHTVAPVMMEQKVGQRLAKLMKF